MGKNKSNIPFEESLYLNQQSYKYYLNNFKELAISRWKYQNIPDEWNIRYMESALFYKGVAVLFYDEVLKKYLSLNAVNKGQLDPYGEWVRYEAYGSNSYKYPDLNRDNSVLVYNNYLHKPSYDIAKRYALYLYVIDRSIQINVKGQRYPRIIKVNKDNELSMRNFMADVDGGKYNIFVDRSFNTDDVSILDNTAPYISDKLQDLKVQIWNEALTRLGISNSVVNKAERLIVDEVLSNQGGIFANRTSPLESRQTALDKFNKMFGTNVKVDYNDAVVQEYQNNDRRTAKTLEAGDSNE